MPIAQTQELAGLFGDIHGVEYKFSTVAEGQPVWSVRTLTFVENISEPYMIELALGSEEVPSNPGAMLGKSCTLTISRAAARSVHGIVAGIEDGVSTAALTVVHVTIVPALAALEHVSSSRIFSEVTIGDLALKELERAFKPFEREVTLDPLQAEYPKREYIAQHRESDLAFLSRILAVQGLWYYFDHPAGDGRAERMVITDSAQKAPPIADEPELELLRERDRSPTQEAITSFGLHDAIGTSVVRVRQFNWTHPEVMEDVEKSVVERSGLALAAYEHGDVAGFDYQQPRYRKHDSDAQTQLRLERYQRGRHVYHGDSNAIALQAGHFMRVEGTEYLITRVYHVGSTVFNTGSAAHRGEYRNSFECVPREQVYRPQAPEKPRIAGVQTALVVGRDGGTQAPSSSAQGEDIVTDEHGRVRVKFHWDLTAAGKGGTCSCWVRVAQGWAGQGWGTQFIPRVGMEVVVQFVDGDPDRPLITGCVYNGLNPPPYVDKPTRSGIKTASSVDPSRYNELRFEDAKDSEEIFVRAQKDYVEEVLNDHSTTVAGTQSNTVKKSQSESVGGDQSLTVTGKRTKVVGGDEENGEEITIKGERKTTVTKAETQTFESSRSVTVDGCDKLVVNNHQKHTIGKGREIIVSEDDDNTSVSSGNKTTSVKAKYTLKSEGQFGVEQGPGGDSKLAMDGAFFVQTKGDVTLTNGKAKICGGKSGKLALEASDEIKLVCGGASLTLKKDGTVAITGMKVSVGTSANSVKFDPAGVTVSGAKVSSSASVLYEVKGPLIKIG